MIGGPGWEAEFYVVAFGRKEKEGGDIQHTGFCTACHRRLDVGGSGLIIWRPALGYLGRS